MPVESKVEILQKFCGLLRIFELYKTDKGYEGKLIMKIQNCKKTPLKVKVVHKSYYQNSFEKFPLLDRWKATNNKFGMAANSLICVGDMK